MSRRAILTIPTQIIPETFQERVESYIRSYQANFCSSPSGMNSVRSHLKMSFLTAHTFVLGERDMAYISQYLFSNINNSISYMRPSVQAGHPDIFANHIVMGIILEDVCDLFFDMIHQPLIATNPNVLNGVLYEEEFIKEMQVAQEYYENQLRTNVRDIEQRAVPTWLSSVQGDYQIALARFKESMSRIIAKHRGELVHKIC